MSCGQGRDTLGGDGSSSPGRLLQEGKGAGYPLAEQPWQAVVGVVGHPWEGKEHLLHHPLLAVVEVVVVEAPLSQLHA